MTIGTGTTPRLTFTFLDAAGAAIGSGRVHSFYLTLAQNGIAKVEKEKAACTFDDAAGTVSATLTQADTLSLTEGVPVEMQWRALLSDGTAIKSNIVLAAADRVLKDGVIA